MIITTGVGKSFRVAQLVADLLQSIGEVAVAIHAVDLAHGSLQMVRFHNARTWVFSHSGNTAELEPIYDAATWIIGFTGNPESQLAQECHDFVYVHCERDGGPYGTIPTRSTVAQLKAAGEIIEEMAQGRSYEELRLGHPGGTLYTEGKDTE